MTADSQWPLQQAVYAALVADAAVGAIIADRIYSVVVPQNAAFPYAVIGGTTPQEWDTKTEDGMQQRIEVDSWSRYRGASEIMRLMAVITDALDSVALVVSGHTLVDLRFDSGIGPLDDPDGKTLHGVSRFDAFTQA